MAPQFAPLKPGEVAVAVREAAAIVGETERTLRKQIDAGRYRLLAGPQSRMRVLLPADVVATHARREAERPAADPPADTPRLVRYAMTPEAVARVAEGVLRRHAAAITAMQQEFHGQYAQRLAAQERTIAAQARTIAELEQRAARAEAWAQDEASRHRALQERLVALVETHASRSLVGQVGRLIQGDRGAS
jgi:hypothetical protein